VASLIDIRPYPSKLIDEVHAYFYYYYYCFSAFVCVSMCVLLFYCVLLCVPSNGTPISTQVNIGGVKNVLELSLATVSVKNLM
jgi:hypothetical protein